MSSVQKGGGGINMETHARPVPNKHLADRPRRTTKSRSTRGRLNQEKLINKGKAKTRKRRSINKGKAEP
eukprot:2257247-Pleurochrysis_carterae.AAC.5